MAVPSQFHFLFGLKPQTEPFHLAHYLCLASCFAVNDPEAIHLHYRYEPFGPLWERIRPRLTLRQLPEQLPLEGFRYTQANASADYSYAHVSDFLRVNILQDEGGVYADMDTLFVSPMPRPLYSHPFVMGHERVDSSVEASKAGGSLCNALFLAEPGSAFGEIWRSRMLDSFDGSWSRHSTFLPFEISQESPHTILVEPESSFFYLDWTREGLHRLFESRVELPDRVYSLHLWAHLWWNRARTDMSFFHEGRLTPEYVAYADTTYAAYARRHLPVDLVQMSRSEWQIRDLADRCATSFQASAARFKKRVQGLAGGR